MRTPVALAAACLVVSASPLALAGETHPIPTAVRATAPTAGMRPSQVGAALRIVRAAAGAPATTSWARRNGLANRVGAYLLGKVHHEEAAREIGAFVGHIEAERGPITRLTSRDTSQLAALRTEKALALHEFRRTPAQVSEELVTASGSVDGKPISERRIFLQHWAPVRDTAASASAVDTPVASAPPSGKIFIFSPGYKETGRAFYREIDAFNRAGHDAFVMDHQWAGFSDGDKGALDSGFGVARDVAFVTAHVDAWAKRTYGEGKYEIVLVGNSMGAGAGIVGAVAMNEQGKVQLGGGAAMPKRVPMILHAPYFATSDNPVAKRKERIGRIPGVRNVPMVVYETERTAHAADVATLEDIRQRASTFGNAQNDLKVIVDSKLASRVWVVQSDNDALANPDVVKRFVTRLGSEAKLISVPGTAHVLEGSPPIIERVVGDGVRWVSPNIEGQRALPPKQPAGSP